MCVLIRDIRNDVLTEGRGYYCFYGDGLTEEFLLHVVSHSFLTGFCFLRVFCDF